MTPYMITLVLMTETSKLTDKDRNTMKVSKCLFIFLFVIESIECGQICSSCTGVETISDCHSHETCTDDEVCFKMQYKTNSGAMLFDLGCSHSQVIQSRYNGSVNFYRDWNSYKEGFGSPYGEYWLGNDIIHALTSNGHHKLYIKLSDFVGDHRYAEYDSFSVSDENNGYRLNVSGYTGNVGGDLLKLHDGMKFSTFDRDNDADMADSCSKLYKGGWWYNYCHTSNLNGLYLSGHHDSYADGIDVYYWHGLYYSLQSVTMMIAHNDVK